MYRSYKLAALAALLLCFTGLEAKPLRVAFVGDPQVDNEAELSYARKSVYKELKERKDLDMVVFLGDLVNDNTSLMPATLATLDSLPCPWYAVPGNHDFDVYRGPRAVVKDSLRKRDLESYRKHFGSPDKSFILDGTRFILMNNVSYEGYGKYEPAFSRTQEAYIDSLLRCSGECDRVVLATHIPYSRMKGREALDSLFAACREVVLVSGHTHNVLRHRIELAEGRTAEEIIAGAACGSWWRGVRDADGVPYALQACGAPRGYFVADFKAESYGLTYKVIGADKDFQASCTLLPAAEEGEQDKLVINVFGGSVDGRLKIKARGLNGGRWTAVEQRGIVAPEVAAVVRENKAERKAGTKRSKDEIIPLRLHRSPHCWYIELDAAALKSSRIRLSYSDSVMSFRQ